MNHDNLIPKKRAAGVFTQLAKMNIHPKLSTALFVDHNNNNNNSSKKLRLTSLGKVRNWE